MVVALWYNCHIEVINMANVQKYTRAAIGGGSLTRHYERAKDEQGNYHQWGNQEIDPDRSHLNYNLAPEREQGQLPFIGERLSEVKCLKRDDVNVMCSWIITAPKGLDESEHDLFFKESYDFLCKKYGEKNVVSAWVHNDETTPHLHFAFVPVVTDKKKGCEKVSAKEALGWEEKGLSKFHGELDAHMSAVFGRDIGILNEATKDGNKEIWELKREATVAEAKAKLEAETRPIEGKVAYEKRINRLEDGIKEKKSMFGDKTTVVITVEDMTAEEARTVLNAAKDRDKMRVRRDLAIKERDEAVSAKNIAVTEKDKAVDKLQGVENREAATTVALEQAKKTQAVANALVQQQANLNVLYKQATEERDKLKNEVAVLTHEKGSISQELVRARETIKNVYSGFLSAVKGLNMLKYGFTDGTPNPYKANLTDKQGRLIDGITNQAAVWAKQDGFHEIADKMKNDIGLSQSIEKTVKALEPKSSRGYDER
jgi:hypothetical protein